jgi:signal transduction histidine kinase
MSYPADGESSAYPAYPGTGDSRPARPPLTKRMRTGHWIAIDCAVALFAAICEAAVVSHNFVTDHARLPLVLVFMAAVFLPVALRRRAPVTAFAALLILGVLLARLSPAVPAAVFLAATYVLYTVTVQARKRTGAASLALLLAVMIGLAIAGTTPSGPGSVRANSIDTGVFVPVGLAGVIAWMTGYSVRQRRRYVVTLQQQAASSAVAEERLRIARELHDVVAHSMSVIAVQAGYGQYVIDGSPDGAKEALGAIQATSRDALEEMRRMLGVLRQRDTGTGPDGAAQPGATSPGSATAVQAAGQPGSSPSAPPSRAPLAPAPGLARLDQLVMRTCGAGVHVTLEVAGEARAAPAGVDLSAYRIIQEALTNVVRHAGTGAVCVVSVTYTELDLVIQVTDDGSRSPAPGPGGGPGGGVLSGTGITGPWVTGSRLSTTGLTSAGPEGTGTAGSVAAGTGAAGTVPGGNGFGGNGFGGNGFGGNGFGGNVSAGAVAANAVHANTGVDGLAAAGAGHGIIGMRERVNLCGGTFHAGPLAAGGFQVLAALPLPASSFPVAGRTASAPQARQAAATAGPGPAMPDPVAPDQPTPDQRTPGQPAPGQPAPGQLAPGQQAPGQPATGQMAPGQMAPEQVTPGQVAAEQVTTGEMTLADGTRLAAGRAARPAGAARHVGGQG